MQLSNRLKAVAGLISKGTRLADVGTDHGYIPIDLVRRGVIGHAVAMDVKKGPLKRAEEHIRQYGLEEQIETRLSDGVCGLGPGEADCMVIAGMGGILTVHIFDEGMERIREMKECVLQPQSEIAMVRRYLWQHEFMIEEENIILEEGKFYPMMRVIPGRVQEIPQERTALYAQYGPCLLEQRHPVLRELLERERDRNQRLCSRLEQKLPHTERRLQELYDRLDLNRQALEILDQ